MDYVQVRYSTMPGQKAKQQPKDTDRESQIYETVNIITTEPSESPAVESCPRDRGKTYPAAVFQRTPLKTPMSAPGSNFHNGTAKDTEKPRAMSTIPISQRPPLPLPEEHYEEPSIEQDALYEAPPDPIKPAPEKCTPRLPAKARPTFKPNPKPVNSGAPVNIKPIARPKPAKKPPLKLPPPAQEPLSMELNNILKKRRNVMSVPIQTIPEHGTAKRNVSTLKPKLPAPFKKPIPPPIEPPAPAGEDYMNSSDEEWTYEPLKPIDLTMYK